MREIADGVLATQGGAATRARLLERLSVAELDDEIRRGRLVRLFPRVYSRPWDADQRTIIELAALRSVGFPAVLSHLSAAHRWGDLADASESVHVTVPADRAPRAQPELVVHRERLVPRQVLHGPLPVVVPAVAAVTSWPLLPRPEGRALVINTVRERRTAVLDLRAQLETRSRLGGRRELAGLIGLLEQGCRSELEVWGLLGVFDVAGLRHAVRQREVYAGGRNYVMDLAYEAERVCVELDGDRFHSTREARDRDRRRDAALAACGWLTLRFSWLRLHTDIEGCRRDTLATLASRHPTNR